MFKTNKRTNCFGSDPESFFPVSELRQENKMVIKICNACNARNECLKYALGWDVTGIWGGTNTKERQAIRKRKNIIPKNVILSYRGMEGPQ